MRNRNYFLMILLAGIALVAGGVFLSAPLGTSTSVMDSNPRMAFAPLVAIIGVAFVWVSFLAYAVISD